VRPTLAADALQRVLTQYLTTTFGLTEDSVAEGLAGFLSHPEQGIFRGPYLRIRTRSAGGRGVAQAPGVGSVGVSPVPAPGAGVRAAVHREQAGQPTLVTTGTGSGKTESFLVRCWTTAAAAAGRANGIKAILLYR